MKRCLPLIMVLLLCFLIVGAVYALSNDSSKYLQNKSWALSGNTRLDPVYLNMNEIEQLLENTRTFVAFNSNPVTAKIGGGAATGTAGDENCLIVNGTSFEYHILGTQTIVAPSMIATGLNISMDQTADDGVEIGQGITAGAKQAYTVGTDGACYLKVTLDIPDISGTDDCAVGWRKAEAYQANIDDYDELASLNVISGAIYIETILNGGTTTSTDTTNTWADAATKTLEVYVSSAGVVTYKIDGVVPTTVASFTFDDAEVIVPFFYFLHHTDLAEETALIEWDCGLQ